MNELNKDLKNMAYQLINSASPDSDSYTVGFPLDISEIFIEVRPMGMLITRCPAVFLQWQYQQNIAISD